MVLKIFTIDGTDAVPINVKDESCFVTHKYDGKDTLTFEIEADNETIKLLNEEVDVQDKKNRYKIKNIDEHSNFALIYCELDLDDWRRANYESYRKTDITLTAAINSILPSGWSVIGSSSYTGKEDVEANGGGKIYAASALDILDAIASAFGCVFNFDTINKKLTVINPDTYVARGEFFSDELNLKNIGFTGSSVGFATRLYAYGKKDKKTKRPITFASVNDGKPYIDDHTYSSKIISVGWKDERYAKPASLLKAARKILKGISFPVRSYECDVSIRGDARLYEVVTLIDRVRETRINHRVVEYKEYAAEGLDVITLSNVQPKISFTNATISKLEQNVAEAAGVSDESSENVTSDDIRSSKENISISRCYSVGQIQNEGKIIEFIIPMNYETVYSNISGISMNVCISYNATNIVSKYNTVSDKATVSNANRTAISLNNNTGSGYLKTNISLIDNKLILVRFECYDQSEGGNQIEFSQEMNGYTILANIDTIDIVLSD